MLPKRPVTVALAACCTIAFLAAGAALAADLGSTAEARRPVPKTPSVKLEMPEYATGRLRVKFADEVLARTTAAGDVFSLSNQQIALPRKIFKKYGLTAIPAINKAPEELLALQERAQELSGRPQPDLAGILAVSGPIETLELAARELNDLPSIEWVTFEVEKFPGTQPLPGGFDRGYGGRNAGTWGGRGADGPTDAPQACCFNDTTCSDEEEAACRAMGGTWHPAVLCAGAVDCTMGACCDPAGACMLTADRATCLALPGIWHGPGSDCTDPEECQAACCFTNGTCTDAQTQESCEGAGGTWHQGELCAAIDCTLGACCGPNGLCLTLVNEAACLALTGLWHGPGSDCMADAVCMGVCCQDDGTCVGADDEAACAATAAWSGPADLNGDGVLDFNCASARCGACCLPSLICEPMRQVDCEAIADAVWQGVGSNCTASECGACCIGTLCVPQLTMDRCQGPAFNGVYQGDNIGCAAAACGGVDACCMSGGTCEELSVGDCIAAMGSPFPGTTCALVDCRIHACCLSDDSCVLNRIDECAASGGNWIEGQSTCEDVECDNQCGDPSVGSCFEPSGNPSAFCSDQTCCEQICELDPFCCDLDNGGTWDAFCAAEANAFCSPHTPHCPGPPEVAGPDHCASPLTGSCFEDHGGGGCNNEDCCNAVCLVDPFCCNFSWGPGCVDTARVVCATLAPSGATPDYEPLQGYLTAAGYNALQLSPALKAYLPFIRTYTAPDTKCDTMPVNPPAEQIFRGYGGQGMNIQTRGEDYTDVNGNGWWDPGEPFEDTGNGRFDVDEFDGSYQDYGADGVPGTFDAGEQDGAYTLGEPYVDVNNNGVFDGGDLHDTVTDDLGFDRIAATGDHGEGNLVWDGPELFTDLSNPPNGTYDPGEPFVDINMNLVWDQGEDFTDDNNNGIREPSFDTWDPVTQDLGVDAMAYTGDLGEFDGVWTPPEFFVDSNGDGAWQPGEPLSEAGCPAAVACNGMWDPGEPFMDSGNANWDPPGGIWGYAEQLLNGTPPADASGMGNLTRGRGAKIAVIEWAYWPGHEDLNVIGEPGQTMILIPAITSPDHGTACLGIMNALNNNTGVTGMVHEAQGYFFPLTSIEEGPREMAAWTSALQTLGAGDVISASYGPGPPIGCLNNDQSMWTMFRLASDLGITVCVAAGNDCYNLDNAEDLGDSGAIVVGACSPGSPHYRLAFSNFCTDPPADNSRSNMVHLKAWGEAVTTCGYGVLPLPDGDITRSYTPVFGGTSAASPQVASVACMLQGLSKQFYGITLSPEMLRDAMGAPGPPPAPTRLFGGFPPGQDCNLDLDPDEGPHRIGSYPDPAGAASTLLSQWFVGFDDSPRLEDVVVVKGQNTRGNRFSLKGSDNNYLKIDPQWVGRNDSPQSPFGGQGVGGGVFGGSIIPQVSQLRYLASGWMVDIVAVGRSDLPSVGTLIVENEVAWPNVFTFMMIEMYDWQQLNWAFVDVRVGAEQAERTDPTNGDVTFEHTTDGAARFVNPTDDRILVRVWSLGFPAFQAGVGGGDTSFLKQFDLINFFVAEGFGVPLP